MADIAFVVDGFNLYHSLRKASQVLTPRGQGTKWLNLDSLFQSYHANIGNGLGNRAGTPPIRLLSHSISYFSAWANHRSDPDTTLRHRMYLDCLKDTGVEVQMGRFKPKDVTCPRCGRAFVKYEEKETDVAIALRIVELVAAKQHQVIALVSGDTDIAPALKSARLLNPALKLVCLFPFARRNEELAKLVDFCVSMNAASYANHQFSDPFVLSSGVSHAKPPNW